MFLHIFITACDNYMAHMFKRRGEKVVYKPAAYDWTRFGNTKWLYILLNAYFFFFFFFTVPPSLRSLTRQPQAHKYDMDSPVL